MTMDIEFSKLENAKPSTIVEMGLWLDEHMPNPCLPEPQRWEIGYSEDGRVGIRFANEHDATYFMVVWA